MNLGAGILIPDTTIVLVLYMCLVPFDVP